MASSSQANVSKFLLIGLSVVVLAILITQYQSSRSCKKNPVRAERESFSVEQPQNNPSFLEQKQQEQQQEVQPSENIKNDVLRSIDFEADKKIDVCEPKDKLTAADLLPADAANSQWAQANPAGQGDVSDQNYLTAGYLIGINTIGQTLRNANLQLRSDPPIDRVNVGPWNQTTIEYDNSRRFFEIGDC